MTKYDLAFNISRAICMQKRTVESFSDFQRIFNYFQDLSSEDLIGIASQYGITVD